VLHGFSNVTWYVMMTINQSCVFILSQVKTGELIYVESCEAESYIFNLDL
jgi:hypothetical protein